MDSNKFSIPAVEFVTTGDELLPILGFGKLRLKDVEQRCKKK